MTTHAIDSNYNLIVKNGSLSTVSNGAEVLQNVKTRLTMFKGEWELDINEGTPWFQEIFIRPVNLANVESILKTRVLKTPNVLRLISFTMEFSKSNRVLTVNYRAETTFGEIINSEVTING